MRMSRGFTLIELLVVISLIGVLVSLLLPALARSRDATYDAQCRANLRGMHTAWIIYIQDYGPRIPYRSKSPTWQNVLTSVYFADGKMAFIERSRTFNRCPAAVLAAGSPLVSPYWYYAANVLWENGSPPIYNETKSWDEIRSPGRYPWYMDGAVKQTSPTSASFATLVPNTTSTWGAPDWGIGVHHSAQTTFNVVFADGSVRSLPIQAVYDTAPAPGQFKWFANR